MIEWKPQKRTVGNRTALNSINGDYSIIRHDGIEEGQKDRYQLLMRIGSILRTVGRYKTGKEAKEVANGIKK